MTNTLCADVGGTKILAGSVDEYGNIGATVKRRSDISSQEAVIDSIFAILDRYIDGHGKRNSFQAIGISLVGRVDASTGTWFEIAPTMPSEPVELSRLIEQRYGIPAFVGNDVYSAALAELRWGVGREAGSFAYLNIGTGIACRLVDHGSMMGGSHWDAGEVGHILVDMSARARCSCGRTGCVEAFASGLGMSNEAHRLHADFDSRLDVEPDTRVEVPDLVKAWESGDALATAVIEHASRGIAALIEMLARFSDPDAVVLGGSVALSDELFSHVLSLVDPHATRLMQCGVRRTGLNPATIALLGCAAHALERMHR